MVKIEKFEDIQAWQKSRRLAKESEKLFKEIKIYIKYGKF